MTKEIRTLKVTGRDKSETWMDFEVTFRTYDCFISIEIDKCATLLYLQPVFDTGYYVWNSNDGPWFKNITLHVPMESEIIECLDMFPPPLRRMVCEYLRLM